MKGIQDRTIRTRLVAGRPLAFRFTLHACVLLCLPVAISQKAGAAQASACEAGITSAKKGAGSESASKSPATASPRHASASSAATQAGMAWVPAGEFWMGSEEAKFADARPVHRVRLDGFWIDRTEVTNQQFARFVQATHYQTVAERKPKPEDYPDADPSKLVAGSVVFTPPSAPVTLQNQYAWWSYVPGASWKQPEGADSTIRGREKHPVVQVAYDDAVAYCRWANKRLPTEAEFEYAERGGLDRKRYAWGDTFMPGGRQMANTFQGHFPDNNTAQDGYKTTAPVASFPANGYGLFDMSGNVWEWTSDWYRPDYYQMLAAGVAVNPQGPQDSYDPEEPGLQKRVQRGGSFLCTDQYCSRYMPGGRGKGDPSTSTNHIGFRCVRSAAVTTSNHRSSAGESARSAAVPMGR